jgi:hypothetical protein
VVGFVVRAFLFDRLRGGTNDSGHYEPRIIL